MAKKKRKTSTPRKRTSGGLSKQNKVILGSLLLAHFVSPHFLWFTAFVGANLLQSAFTKFCPMEIFLKKLQGANQPSA